MGRPLYVAKDFDNVLHYSIKRELRQLRYPKSLVTLVRNIYQGAKTRIHRDGLIP